MGFMQSAWGRALGGAGAAAAGIASKYIDDEIRTNREQFIADLAHANRVKYDQYELGDQRQAQIRKNAADAAMAQGAAQRANTVAGANDADYQGALDTDAANATRRKVASENAVIEGTAGARIDAERRALQELTPAKVAAEKAMLEGTMGAKAKQAGLIARATDLDAGNRSARAALLNMEVGDRQRLSKLYDEYLAVVNYGQMPDVEKARKLAPITNAIQALKLKSAPAAARNPEFDTEKVIEERTNPDGTTTKTERVQRRLPGNMPERQAEADPIKAAMDAARAARQGK